MAHDGTVSQARRQPVRHLLGLLLQMPIFMGLYYALQESIHFRLASFQPLHFLGLDVDPAIWPLPTCCWSGASNIPVPEPRRSLTAVLLTWGRT